MPGLILDGAAFAADVRNQVSRDVARFTVEHGPIRLAAVLVGDVPAARLYAESQRKRSLQAGVQHELIELPADTSRDDLFATIQRLNRDPDITGIMLQMPLPPSIEPADAFFQIDPYKDVEGVNPANIGMLFYATPILAPCTALAVHELILRSGVEVRGAEAVVVGQSPVVGRPIASFLTTCMATVTGCHVATRDLAAHTRRADILVSAVGKAGLITADHVKPGAIVIDVGINNVTVRDADGEERERIVGDVDFDAVAPLAGAITPVPGGVGPLTVAMLLRNTVEAANKQLQRD